MTFDLRDAIRLLHATALFTVAVFAFAAVSYTMLYLLGLADWLQLEATLGGVAYPDAGPWFQGALTAILGAMAFYLPTTVRMMALETSHRNVHISMNDVARPYHDVHTADRAGIFTLSGEFDAVGERLAYLRDHPDLANLEGGVMGVAAKEERGASQLSYLDDRLQSPLPLLGYALEHDGAREPEAARRPQCSGNVTNVVPMPQKPAAE